MYIDQSLSSADLDIDSPLRRYIVMQISWHNRLSILFHLKELLLYLRYQKWSNLRFERFVNWNKSFKEILYRGDNGSLDFFTFRLGRKPVYVSGRTPIVRLFYWTTGIGSRHRFATSKNSRQYVAFFDPYLMCSTLAGKGFFADLRREDSYQVYSLSIAILGHLSHAVLQIKTLLLLRQLL